jgi:hypothetical protein
MLFFTLEAKLSALKSLFVQNRASTTPSLLKSDFNKLVIACFNLRNYSDDIIFKNGLTNTGNRIAAIGGEITFETQAEQGLKIHIHFPIAKSKI